MELNREQEQATTSNNKLYDYVKRIVAAVNYKGNCDHEDVPSILRKFAKGYEQKIFELENRLKECENGYEGTLFLDRCKLHDVEEKVKELTEDNEYLKTQVTATEERYESRKESDLEEVLELRLKVEELTEENEKNESLIGILKDANQREYRLGYEDGVRALAEKLKNYYENLPGNSYSLLIAYTIKTKKKELLGDGS